MTQPYSLALRRSITACFIISFLFVIVLTALLQASSAAARDAVEWIVHTGTVLESANDLQDALKDPEARSVQLRRLRELTLDNPVQQDELAALDEHFKRDDQDGAITAGMRVFRAREVRLLNARLTTFRTAAARTIIWRQLLFWGTLVLLTILGIATRRMFTHHEGEAEKILAQAQAALKQINLMRNNRISDEQREELEKIKVDMDNLVQKLSRGLK